MTAEARKAASEAKLISSGVPVNLHLPLIESEDETELRSIDEVLHRLIALWAVVGKSFMGDESRFADYIATHRMESWLSEVERDFLADPHPDQRAAIHFSWQLEAFYFIAWCAGLLECGELPLEESSVQTILHLFPDGAEPPDRLRAAIQLRTKSEILDRADLLYRLHWAVRNAGLTGASPSAAINGGVVQEWHRAVNWMIRYDFEDDWDHVGTDT